MDLDLIAAEAPGAVGRAASVLAAGGLVVLPTDTVYGVATATGSTSRLFAAKERPVDAALAVLVADRDQAGALADFGSSPSSDRLDRLLAAAWPGPLTVIVPRRRPDGSPVDLGGDPATVGVRCPDHDLVRALAGRVGPLATTSANRHGSPTPVLAIDAARSLAADPDLVIDGGPCAGVASTVVDCTTAEWRVVREGSFPLADLRRHLAG